MTDSAERLSCEASASFDAVNARLHYRHGKLTATDGAFELRTVLQPLFSVRHQRPIGCEALIRGQDAEGRELPAWRILERASSQEALELDRLCATLHARNFSAISGESNWLFLNLSTAEFDLGVWADDFFPALLRGCGLKPQQLVVEILESPVSPRVDLGAVISYFRELGVLVALDDFGAGHSNFERIWKLKPDIVKLDRCFVLSAERDRAMRRSLPSVVDILHQHRCLVVAEGIETERQALIAMDAGIDIVQGYFFAYPFEISGGFCERRVDWERLQDRLQDTIGSGTLIVREQMISHLARMYAVAEHFRQRGEFGEGLALLLELPGVLRFFAIDEYGLQRDRNVDSHRVAAQPDLRLAPLAAAEGASWYSRPYFRKARQYPDEIHISKEYLSCADACMCVTLSILVDSPIGVRVLCCDVLAE